MARKKIAVVLTSHPAGAVAFAEGLRAAAGLATGADEHSVSVVLAGDGIWLALKTFDRRGLEDYLASLKALGVPLLADGQKILEADISPENTAGDVTPLKNGELPGILGEQDLVLTL
jgi:sulfur relay (sulfurtransferase) DsrF/TusC family protein